MRQIFGGVDARRRRMRQAQNDDGMTMPERAQLLERLDRLQWRMGQIRITAQESDPIGIQPDVTQHRSAQQRIGQPVRASGARLGIALERNGGTRKIQRAAARIGDHLTTFGFR